MNVCIHHILSRRTIRKFTDQKLNREDLKLIVKCGQYAPTAMGKQPWHFSIITQEGILKAIEEACKESWLKEESCPPAIQEQIENGTFNTFRGAPYVVVVSGEESNPFAEADCANAMTNMANAAESMEIGSCYIASFRKAFAGEHNEELRAMCEIPEGYVPYFALALGRPAEAPQAAERREGTISYL